MPRPYVRYDGDSTGKQNNHVERKCYLHELASSRISLSASTSRDDEAAAIITVLTSCPP